MTTPNWHLVDTTLRDGMQAAGVALCLRDKLAIAHALVELGLTEFEVGIPGMGIEEVRSIQALAQVLGPQRVVTWCRGTAADLDAAKYCGVGRVHLSFPTSRLHQDLWRADPTHLLVEMVELVSQARRHFDRVYVGAQDASRAAPEFLFAFAEAALAGAADRIRFADTVGCLAPSRVASALAPLMAGAPDTELEFHAHNDLGLATANTLAAFEAGAKAASVTVNGLGERAGNAALEEVALALRVALGVDPGLNYAAMGPASDVVARATHRVVPPEKPVVGSAAFRHESGIHCAGLLQDERAYEAFNPALVGRTRGEFVLGTHTGGAAVAAVLKDRGIRLDRNAARALAHQVRTRAELRGSALGADEVAAMCAVG